MGVVRFYGGMAGRRVPVTLISGFSGVGKSAVVDQLRRTLKARRPVFFSEGDEDFDSIVERMDAAVEADGADCVIVECWSGGEPFLSAEALAIGNEDGVRPHSARLDTLVTVIDGSNFFQQIQASRDLIDVVEDCPEDDDRTVSEIMIEQVEFADVIVINKIDLCSETQLNRTKALVERLNPRARVFATSQGAAPATELVGTGLFDFEDTDDGAGWLSELEGDFMALPSSEGVVSFTYLDRRPMHPGRFNELLSDFDMPGLIRAKGSVWVASRHHEIGVWSLAGRASLLTYGGAWFASTPTRDWPASELERADIMQEWVAPFGDRRQEIAFIGINLNEREIRARLDRCLLTSNEMVDGPESWDAFVDPLPDWHLQDT